MRKFDRYILSQLMVMFGFFALVLVSVYWVNNTVKVFDRLISDGHSAAVVLEFTLLSLPNVVRSVLPIAAFGAAVYVTNRLSSESELTVMQATGFSPWRLAWPVIVFGVITATLMSIMTHTLVPVSLQQLRDRETDIAKDLYARLLRPGTFLHPAKGITLYIRDISDDGRLSDIFVSDRRNPDVSNIYTAKTAYLMRDTRGTKLVMVNGLVQVLSTKDQLLSTTSFEDLSYDISALIKTRTDKNRNIKQIPTGELLRWSGQIAEQSGVSLGRVLQEAHGRFQQPLLCLVAALIGFSTLLTAGFSRFGIGRQIVFAIALLVLIKLTESVMIDPVRANPNLWPLIYAPTLVGCLLTLGCLSYVARTPYRRVSKAAHR
ncbi:MAG: LPS export ABC transporter permease LptF [Paracoccaceae bacterium]|nr:LPS export ABC transporter permease LptF [Paracoccaceae bacterium]